MGRKPSGEEPLDDPVAVDAYESQQFWTAAEAAGQAETPDQRADRQRVEAEVDTWMDGLR